MINKKQLFNFCLSKVLSYQDLRDIKETIKSFEKSITLVDIIMGHLRGYNNGEFKNISQDCIESLVKNLINKDYIEIKDINEKVTLTNYKFKNENTIL